jgi:hypothetical protein
LSVLHVLYSSTSLDASAVSRRRRGTGVEIGTQACEATDACPHASPHPRYPMRESVRSPSSRPAVLEIARRPPAGSSAPPSFQLGWG